MELKDVVAISERASQPVDVLDEWDRKHVLDYVTHYAETGESHAYNVWVDGEVKIGAYAALFGLGTLKDRVIIERFHSNNMSAAETRVSEPVTLWADCTVNQMLQNLADQHMMDDFANDFRTAFAVQLDDTDCMAFGLKQDELVGVCSDCDAAGYDDELFGCGHAENTYTAQYWFLLCKITDLPTVRWEDGTLG